MAVRTRLVIPVKGHWQSSLGFKRSDVEVANQFLIDEVCDADKRADPMYRAMFDRLGLYIDRVPEPNQS